jgi:hypothetical protein
MVACNIADIDIVEGLATGSGQRLSQLVIKVRYKRQPDLLWTYSGAFRDSGCGTGPGWSTGG